MTYNIGSTKWGTPELGEPGETIAWTADLSTGLQYSDRFTQDDFEAALQAAFDKWMSVAAVSFEQTTSTDPDVVDLRIAMADLPGTAAGTAEWYRIEYDGIDQTVGNPDSEILVDSDRLWTPYGEGGGYSFYAVVLHEIGHILGLGHVEDETEIMNPVVSASDLGDGDIAGVQLLYGRDGADETFPDGYDPDAPMLAADTTPAAGSDGDAAAGGMIAALLGAIAALLGLLLGAGPGAAGLAAAGHLDEGDGDGCGDLLGDVVPLIEAEDAAPFECDHDHEQGDDGDDFAALI